MRHTEATFANPSKMVLLAASRLEQALTCHPQGDLKQAAELIRLAGAQMKRQWIERNGHHRRFLVKSRSEKTDLENLLVACVACNFGRDRYTLEEVVFRDPRTHLRFPNWPGRFEWSGLEGFLPVKKRVLQDPNPPMKVAV